jgi:hypothetical protein
MKTLKYTLAFLAVILLFTACDKDDTDFVKYHPDKVVAAKMNKPAEIVLEDETKGVELPAITWTHANYGFDAAVNYTVELGIKGTNFEPVAVIGSVNGNSLVIKGLDLQNAMDNIGAELGSRQEVEIRVKSKIVDYFDPVVSDVTSFFVTTYLPAEKEYNKVWIVGDYCGWNHANSQFLYDIAGNSQYFEGWVMFNGKAQNGFKITYTDGWHGNDIGTNDSEVVDNKIKVEPGGNIGLFDGLIMYLKLDNRDQTNRTLERVRTISRIGIVGSATPNGWGAPDTEMIFNESTRVFEATVTLVDGEIKFRADDDWALSWGLFDASASKNPNQLTPNNGKNIEVSAGTYKITFNLNKVDPTFEMIKQ